MKLELRKAEADKEAFSENASRRGLGKAAVEAATGICCGRKR